MSDARREILGRVRTALGEARGTQVKIPRGYNYRLTGDDMQNRADVVALFGERVTDYRELDAEGSAAGQDGAGARHTGTVLHAGADDLGTAVAAALWGKGVGRVVVPADLPYGWLSELDGVEVLADSALMGTDALEAVDGVVTGCAVAIAQTGTIVLDGGRAQGRRALTLIPDYHLCVIHADQIVGALPEAIERLDPYRPLTWISGTSVTTHIELTPVEGMMHGPRVLDVLVVDEALRAG
jgi:L-lactate dehydrogenase complex protein LldG